MADDVDLVPAGAAPDSIDLGGQSLCRLGVRATPVIAPGEQLGVGVSDGAEALAHRVPRRPVAVVPVNEQHGLAGGGGMRRRRDRHRSGRQQRDGHGEGETAHEQLRAARDETG